MSDAFLMRSARFRKEREADWKRLEALITRVEKRGLNSLEFEQARDLATLYRQAMNSLSLAREISLDKSLLFYLESLCARAYLAVYAPQESLRGLMARLFIYGMPGAVRRCAPQILIAFLTLGLGALAGYFLFVEDPTWYNTIMPPELADTRGINSSREDLLSVIYDSERDALAAFTAFASFLFSHNTQIAIFIFSLGVLVCLPSFMLTFYNGLVIGVFVALHIDRGIGYDIAAWLSIHGVTELSAIVIACAGGFTLGLAVLFPGELTRGEALRRSGRDAVKLAILAAIMLVVAAILEGFFRQIVQNPETRLIVGWGIGGLWLAYFLLVGHKRPGTS